MPLYTTQVSLSWSIATGSPGTNTWDVRADSPPASGVNGDLDAFSSAINSFYVSIRDIYPNSVTISSDGRWRALDAAAEANGDYTAAPWSVTGQSGSDWMPPFTQILLRRDSANGGRSGKGHLYLGPVGMNTVGAGGAVLAATRNEIISAAQSDLSTGVPESGAFVVYSRKQHIARDVTTWGCSSEFAVLRSRRD